MTTLPTQPPSPWHPAAQPPPDGADVIVYLRGGGVDRRPVNGTFSHDVRNGWILFWMPFVAPEATPT